ncbi:MAG TPA: SprT-like domain-containing protein [Flavobacteriales bacterium]|nr:SprT-like domain-containing protein [Flavobacteriales bacterium]
MSQTELAKKLRPFLPDGVEHDIAYLIIHYKVHFRITKPRESVYGDYTSPILNQPHKITVNGDQNKYAFFITTLHEFAHLYTWEKHRNKVKPHGMEWKTEFQRLTEPYFKRGIFPPELVTALKSYMSNPAASSCSDENLMTALRLFDRKAKPILKDLPENSRFVLNNTTFVKGRLVRSRFECIAVENKQTYLISSTAEVSLET